MQETKGTCQKHGEFNLREGCKQCLAEKGSLAVAAEEAGAKVTRTTIKYKLAPEEEAEGQAGITPAQDELEDGLNSEGLTLVGAGGTGDAPPTTSSTTDDAPATEPDRMVNLCDTCKKHLEYPVCSPRDVEFGDGRGNDNIIKCANYDPAEPVADFPEVIRKEGRIATLTKARKHHRCAECPEWIKPQSHYYSVVAGGSGLGGIKFPSRVHPGCLELYFGRVKRARLF
ncbi:hypothetical protein ES708_09194 [subsurface metagenome]